MHEVRCAVNGVDDEGGFFGELLARVVGFFSNEFEGWIGREQASRDHLFDCLVGFGDEVGR